MFTAEDRAECSRLLNRYYGDRKFYDTLYRETIRRHLSPGARLLDAGCGRYMTYCNEFSGLAETVGIDLENTLATDNAHFPFGVRGDVGRLPFRSGYFDLIICRSVIEHLAEPAQVFQEFHRVLSPNGKVILVTPNKYDYVSLIAALTPYRFHRYIVSKIFGVSEDDVFPTLYRANTISALRRVFRAAGFIESELQMVNHYPAYLMFSPILFRLGVFYERLTSLRPLRSLRGSILSVFQKQGLPADYGVTGDTAPVGSR